MWISIVRRIYSGIACGGLVSFFSITILMINDITPDIYELWLYILMSFVLGIYFGLASFIFVVGDWSPLKKTVIHFCLSIIVYYSIALSIGWIPLHPLAILSSLGIFILIYIVFWIGFSIYYKKLEASLNKSLPKK